MLSTKVTVLIPVGKNLVYRQYLPEAIQSVLSQSLMPDEILLIDDGAGITHQDIHDWFEDFTYAGELHYKGFNVWYKNIWECTYNSYYEGGANIGVTTRVSLWHSPAPNGFISAFNNGVALANNDLIIYLAADDKLEQDAIADCVMAWEDNNQKDGWYALTYNDAGRVDDTPINAAMITRGLWDWLGGYPPASFAGPDAALLSILMVHAPDRIIKVKPGKVNYTIRHHDYQETKVTAQVYSEEMTSIRNKLTLNFRPIDGVMLK